MKRYTVRTPGGNEATFDCREQTTDRMTVEVDVEQDRYGIASLPRKGGMHIDIGAHIGTWIIAVLIDDPQAVGLAVEPLTENVQRIAANARINGVSDRLHIRRGAFGAERGTADILWDFHSEQDPERAMMHRYIGGFSLDLMPPDVTYGIEEVPSVLPADIITGPVACLKVAGETSERALIGADLSKVDYVLGKYHAEAGDLIEWLSRTHDVQTQAAVEAPDLVERFGWYHAVLRG